MSTDEWSFYWDGSKDGKRCWIDGIHNGNLETTDEISVKSKLGSKLKGISFRKVFKCFFVFLYLCWISIKIIQFFSVSDPHRSNNCRAPGDKSYSVPEYLAGFHKEGSTVPAVNFGYS